MNKLKVLFLIALTGLFSSGYTEEVKRISGADLTCKSVLYQNILNDTEKYPELIADQRTVQYTNEGLFITGKENLVMLDLYYSLGERIIRYHVKFGDDTKAVFQSNTGDFKAFVDIPEKNISIEGVPLATKKVDFLNPDHEYLVEIHKNHQYSKIRIMDVFTGQYEETGATNDGSGGVGAGSVQAGLKVGMQWDKYCFGLQSGSSLLVKEIYVLSGKCNLTLLLYGDSITQPDNYFPTNDYPQSWTRLIADHIQGKTMTSGRSGCKIDQVLERIKNELPYVKAKYVMVTIGTNGGNTEENLSELIEYILAQGSIPILNNIPCNEHGTQTEINRLIEKVRKKYGIKGCKFDLVTSLNNDGKEVDKTTMWLEDYTNGWGQIYHHPNVKGSLQMFTRTFIDIPEIYE